MPQPALTQAERTALSDTAMIDAAIDELKAKSDFVIAGIGD